MPTTLRLPRQAGVVAASLLLAALTGSPSAHATIKPKPPKPDLVLTHAKFALRAAVPLFWTLRGESETFDWSHQTKNKGPGDSKKSRTGVVFVDRHGTEKVLASLKVPGLERGITEDGKAHFKEDFDTRWRFGTYTPKICADIKDKADERHEGHNCKEFHDITVAPAKFTGTVRGFAPLHTTLMPGVTLSWAGTVKADLADGDMSNGNDGIFRYKFRTGGLTYHVSGTDALTGCTWSGHGVYHPGDFDTRFNVIFGDDALYFAHDSLKPTWNFPALMSCPGEPTPLPANVQPFQHQILRWFDTGDTGFALDDPGVTELKGVFTDQRANGPTSYSWDLKALGLGEKAERVGTQ